MKNFHGIRGLILISLSTTFFVSIFSREQYGMYVWTHGFDSYVEGCDEEILLEWNSDDTTCFTHTWETEAKRQWLWDTCNYEGREIGAIFISDVKTKLQESYWLNDCSTDDVQLVSDMLTEGHTTVQNLEIYALFADSDAAVSEQNHIKYVVWYNDHCASSDVAQFDGVAINNEAWKDIMCTDDPLSEVQYLDNLHRIVNETSKQVSGTLKSHYSVGWHWGKCNSVDYNTTWNGITQKPTKHFIDIFDSIDIQVALVSASTIVERADDADYWYAVSMGKTVYATSYCNDVPDACTSTHFPDSCEYTWANSRKSEDYLFSMFDEYVQQVDVVPCIHYFRGVYSSGGHSDWPSHWNPDSTESSQTTVIFADDFCDEISYWTVLSGNWTRYNCVYTQSSMEQGAYTWIGASVSPTQWEDYAVTWSMMRDSSCSGRAGVLVRSQSMTGVNRMGQQYFIGVGNDNVMLSKYDNGTRTILHQSDSVLSDTRDQWVTGVVQVQGSTIQVTIMHVNGESYSFVEEDASLGHGVLGLRTFQCPTTFDSVTAEMDGELLVESDEIDDDSPMDEAPIDCTSDVDCGDGQFCSCTNDAILYTRKLKGSKNRRHKHGHKRRLNFGMLEECFCV